jgi:PAS domain S-box-containing protein
MENVGKQDHEIEVAFLSLINESKRTAELVHSAVSFFCERFGLEAVGVRLQNVDDYPYFETIGFPEEFLRNENSLCAQDEVEQLICNNAGNPILKCMCGTVICGLFDPSKPFFTARGSFWTNSTTELLATTNDLDLLAHMRCISKGYESVALIALRTDEDILGLLQLNDTRKGQFSLETITIWERLAGYLAVALVKARIEEFLLEAYETLLIQSEKLEAQSEELLKANEILLESEEKYRNLIETANEGIVLVDAEFKITYVNKKIEEMFGYSTKEYIGRSMWDFISEESKDIVKLILQNGLQGISESLEIKYIRKDGSPLWALVNTKSIYDTDDKFISLMSMLTDITDRKQVQVALQKSETYFRALAENSPDIITRFDRQLRHIFVNPAAVESYDIPLDVIIGKTQGELGRDPKNVRFWEERLENTFIIGKIETLEYQYLSPQGKKYYFNTKIVPEFSDGKVISVLAISRDITNFKEAEAKLKETLDNLENLVEERTVELKQSNEALRESEVKYRNIVETANEGIIIIDNEAIITYANKRMADMLGYTLGESIGIHIWNFLIEESKAIIQLNLKSRRLGIDDNYELKLIKKDGSILWALVNAKSLLDTNGEFVGSMSMLTDITKRKEVEQILANFELAREKEIHHRIKNNLQVVSSLLDLQACKFKGRNDIKDSDVIDAFSESQSRVKSMALIHEELYRGEGSETLNFSAYIDELADNLLSTYSLGNINIILNKNMEKDFFFDMETAIPLGIIINEIISNSFKHAFKGRDRGEIRIKLYSEEKGDFVNIREKSKCKDCKSTNFVLSVSDNGVGVPDNLDIENLASLGLQLITSLVDQLDGELEIKRNNGTEFTIRFIAIENNNKASASVPKNNCESSKSSII